MTITVELPPEAEALLRRRASHRGTSEDDLATHLLTRLLTEDEDDFQESVAAIRQGFADADAGRTIAFEDFAARSRVQRAARRSAPPGEPA